MKIAVTSTGKTLDSQVDLRFGRTAFFAVYDETAEQWDFLTNQQNLQASQGAGIQAAQTVIDAEVDVLLASNVGPKAMTALKANGVDVFKVEAQMTLEQALTDYTGGKLIQMQDSNVEGHWV